MSVNTGERMEALDPEDIESMHRHIAAFLSEQVLAGADPDALADLGYPEIDDEAVFEVRAAGGDPTDMRPDPTVETDKTETPKPTEQPDSKPEVRYRKRRKSRKPRDLAAGDLRPDLKPFPYGTKED